MNHRRKHLTTVTSWCCAECLRPFCCPFPNCSTFCHLGSLSLYKSQVSRSSSYTRPHRRPSSTFSCSLISNFIIYPTHCPLHAHTPPSHSLHSSGTSKPNLSSHKTTQVSGLSAGGTAQVPCICSRLLRFHHECPTWYVWHSGKGKSDWGGCIGKRVRKIRKEEKKNSSIASSWKMMKRNESGT